MLKKLIGLSVVALFTTACVHIPESVRVDESTPLTEFYQVRDNAKLHLGEMARWGGVIAKVENHANNTMLEVVNFELKSSTRPSVKDETQGRFRIYYHGLLDPVIYKEGRSITALGKVAPSEQGVIGEHEYLYPVLNASAVHLWKKVQKVDAYVFHQPFWYTPSLWYYPRPYYGGRYYYAQPNVKAKAKAKK
ncbi:starvation lipoprotein Slp [Thalassotalea insulae]|uniref:Starvation lipoprotein Slp n=1 Tax=Thalassotalea insulae TaxID=2056778 RepID=A0ABQ6GR67_9GAMM|nr:Slp family lipoprotein [Thalassotalea insulae]GLX77072.1 starvation lipoprotein Slp [Thalassotalea insulae]